jgi:hypothetical protein
MRVDNRNSAAREENLWDKTPNLWNDNAFESWTLFLSDLHPQEFLCVDKLSFEKVQQLRPATPSKLKVKLTQMTLSLSKGVSAPGNEAARLRVDLTYLQEIDCRVPTIFFCCVY